MNADAQKRAAASRAVEFVRPGMRLGLGTGSTAKHFVELVGERVCAGLDIIAVPTSEATRADAERCGIRLTTLDDTPELDLTVDGADEVAPDLSLIKGGGGALLREKIVAAASARMVVIADESKWVPRLGRFPLPIEVAPFGFTATLKAVEKAITELGASGPLSLRQGKDGHAFVTDGGHWIIDAALGRIDDPKAMADALAGIPGVMEHGLFIGLAQTVILAGRPASGSSNGRDYSSNGATMMRMIEAVKSTSRLAAVAAVLVMVSPAAHSQQPSAPAIATAKELIVATNSTAVFTPLIAGVVEQAKLLYLQQNPALAQDLNEIAAQLRTELAPRFSELSDEMARLYATHFTNDELKAILVFYQSPVGKKLLDQQPNVVESSMKFAQDWANKLSDQVIARMRAELKKRGHAM